MGPGAQGHCTNWRKAVQRATRNLQGWEGGVTTRPSAVHSVAGQEETRKEKSRSRGAERAESSKGDQKEAGKPRRGTTHVRTDPAEVGGCCHGWMDGMDGLQPQAQRQRRRNKQQAASRPPQRKAGQQRESQEAGEAVIMHCAALHSRGPCLLRGVSWYVSMGVSVSVVVLPVRPLQWQKYRRGLTGSMKQQQQAASRTARVRQRHLPESP
jgi:hypothetical protein